MAERNDDKPELTNAGLDGAARHGISTVAPSVLPDSSAS